MHLFDRAGDLSSSPAVMSGFRSRPRPKLPLHDRLQRISQALALAIAGLATVVLAGWLFGNRLDALGRLLSMPANTAISILAAGLSLFLSVPGDTSTLGPGRAAKLLALVPLAFGTATLVQYVLGVDLGVDLLFFRERALAEGGLYPGRPSPTATVNLVLAGAALLLIDVTYRRERRPAQLLSVVICSTGWLACLGYLFGVERLYGIGAFTRTAAHTAAACVALGVGLLLARPNRGLMSVVTSNSVAGLMARRLLPASAALPLALGWLLVVVVRRAGIYEDVLLGATLLVWTTMLFSTVMIWQSAGSLLRVDNARVAAERAEREQLEWTRVLLSSTADGVIGTDALGRVRFMNPVAARLTGWSSEQAEGKPLEEVFVLAEARGGASIRPPSSADLRDGSAAPRSDDIVLLSRSGESTAIEESSAPIRAPGGDEIRGVVLAFRDVSHRKRADSVRRRSQDRARRLQQVTAALSATMTRAEVAEAVVRQGSIALGADSALLLAPRSGGDELEVIGGHGALAAVKHDTAAISTLARMLARATRRASAPNLAPIEELASDHPELAELVSRQTLVPLPITFEGRHLATLVVGFSGRPEPSEELEHMRSVAAQAAIAFERARLYESERQAVRVRDDFLAIASHELNTPLMTLKLQLEKLLRYGARSQPLDESLGRALRQTERLERLVRDLLDVSRIGAGHLRLTPERVDLTAVVRQAAERLEPNAKAAGTELSLTLAEGAIGFWDRMRVEQLVDNLLANAIKFGAARPIDVTVEADDAHVTLTVRDRGIGIDAASRSRIFEPFERGVSISNYGGFGLGLWIARQTVEATGGTIQVDSEPGAGSTFTVKLPRDRH